MKTSPLSDKYSQQWCDHLLVRGGARKQIQHDLSELIYSIISKPWLGNATTGELLDEIKARVDLGYRTVGEESDFDLAP